MSDAPFLEHVWLAESSVECDHRDTLKAPVEIGLDIEELSFEVVLDRVVVKVGLSLGLRPKGSDDLVADLAATFRLVYRMDPPLHTAERRAFACDRALADVWLFWRTWLHETLSLMGLGPTPLPAQVPPGLVAEGREAFDLTMKLARRGRRV